MLPISTSSVTSPPSSTRNEQMGSGSFWEESDRVHVTPESNLTPFALNRTRPHFSLDTLDLRNLTLVIHDWGSNWGSNWLPTSRVSKLLIDGEPGGILREIPSRTDGRRLVESAGEFVGDGLHFIQEDRGGEIGAAIVRWANVQGILSLGTISAEASGEDG